PGPGWYALKPEFPIGYGDIQQSARPDMVRDTAKIKQGLRYVFQDFAKQDKIESAALKRRRASQPHPLRLGLDPRNIENEVLTHRAAAHQLTAIAAIVQDCIRFRFDSEF